MQEQTQTQINQNLVTTSLADQAREVEGQQGAVVSNDNFIRKISEKVDRSENILVTLSRNPSVDEMVAAIGLTMFLDDLQKHTTAIYSGETPNALDFLRPQNTFENNTDSLQDFIIALNKEKADHLRYKLEDDFVKIYITPYKTIITEKDLEFSRGDYNVDLVIALGVPSAGDLDEALTEYGRIMHNAATVDITTDVPGRFGEIEWSDPLASSVSEMVTKLILAIDGKDGRLNKDIATALLTGIVAATGRFSNDRTTSDTLELASKLMSMGADQQLISANVMDNRLRVTKGVDSNTAKTESDSTNLTVNHDEDRLGVGTVVQPDVPEAGTVEQVASEKQARAAMASAASLAVQEAMSGLSVVDSKNAVAQQTDTTALPPVSPEMPQPPKDYAKMIDEALAEPGGVDPVQVGPVASGGVIPEQPVVDSSGTTDQAVGPVVVGAPTDNSQVQPVTDAPVAGQGLGAPVVSQPVNNLDAPSSVSAGIMPEQTLNNGAPAGAVPLPNVSTPELPPASGLPGVPVATPESVVLPPPPAPTTGEQMMPPI